MKKSLLLLLLPLLSEGLGDRRSAWDDKVVGCDSELQAKYCDAWYGGDYHTACHYCGIGRQCPAGRLSGRVVRTEAIRYEILRRHNEYRSDVQKGKNGMPPTQVSCLPPLQWDDELAEVAQIWADQCAMIIYPGGRGFPRIFHEKSSQRTTSKFQHPPGVGQNVAWALTEGVNFTQIIDDLWYRDIRNLEPGIMDDFRVDEDDPRTTLVTQMLWGHTTHIGCGWTQIDVGDDKFAGIYPGRYENFFVCNYGVGGNVPGEPVYQHPDCNTELGMHFCIHHVTHEVFAGNKVEDLPVIKQKDEQIFSNFSVETRTIIGSCLEAIQCIEEKENFQCRDLSEICHSKGPQPAPAKTPVTRQDLECRIENILCHIDNTYPTLKCQEKYENCKKSTPQSRENPSASKTHGLMGTVPELNEVLDQALDSVIDSEVKATLGEQIVTKSSLTSGDKKNNNVESTTRVNNPESTTVNVALVSTKTSTRPTLLVTSTNIDTRLTTTILPSVEITVTTLAPISAETITEQATEPTTEQLSELSQVEKIGIIRESDVMQVVNKDPLDDDADENNEHVVSNANAANNYTDDKYENTFDVIPSSSITSTQASATVIPNQSSTDGVIKANTGTVQNGNQSFDQNDIIILSNDIQTDDSKHNANENDMQDKNVKTVINDNNQIENSKTPIINVNDLIPLLQNKVFAGLNNSGLVPTFDGVDLNLPTEVTNDTLVIFQDIFVGPDGVINLTSTSNLDGLLLGDNILNTIQEPGLLVHPSIENLDLSSEDKEEKKIESEESIQQTNAGKTDIDQISDVDLQYIIMRSLPNFSNNTRTKIQYILKSYGGQLDLSFLHEIGENKPVTNPNIPTDLITKISKVVQEYQNKVSGSWSESKNRPIEDVTSGQTPEIDDRSETGDLMQVLPLENVDLITEHVSSIITTEPKSNPTERTNGNESEETSHLNTKKGVEDVISPTKLEQNISFGGNDTPGGHLPESGQESSSTSRKPDSSSESHEQSDKMVTEKSFNPEESTANSYIDDNQTTLSNLPEDHLSNSADKSVNPEELLGNIIDDGISSNVKNQHTAFDPVEIKSIIKPNEEVSLETKHATQPSDVDHKQDETVKQDTAYNHSETHTLSSVNPPNEQPINSVDSSGGIIVTMPLDKTDADLVNGSPPTTKIVKTEKEKAIENTQDDMENFLTTEKSPTDDLNDVDQYPQNLNSVNHEDLLTNNKPTNPSTFSRKVEESGDFNELVPSVIPEFFNTRNDSDKLDVSPSVYDEEGNCYRRYINSRRQIDISYYNTTVRTRLLTAICLEGMRCKPEEDATRCQFLHRKCNEHVDTSLLSFQMRVTLSECTVEDVLCHLGHRTPVMCCQDKYSECVERSASHKVTMSKKPNNPKSRITENKDNPPIFQIVTGGQEGDVNSEDPFLFLLGIQNVSDAANLSENETNLINKITDQLFLSRDSIINSLGEDSTAGFLTDNKISVDNETLPVFQDFIVILDDSDGLNQTLLSGDNTIKNILENMKANSTDFKILFDPDSTVIGFDGEMEPQEELVLDQIKSEINKAVGKVAEMCSNNICIKNIDENKMSDLTIFNKTVNTEIRDQITEEKLKPNKTGLIMLEPKTDIHIKLQLCQKALQCVEPVPCMFAQSRCLQLSGIDILPMKTRQEIAGCKIESLKCLMEVKTMIAQDRCLKRFTTCGAMLGVDIYESSIVNFIHHETSDHGKENAEEQNISSNSTLPPNLLKEILRDIRKNLNNELGNVFDIDVVTFQNDSSDTVNVKDDSTLKFLIEDFNDDENQIIDANYDSNLEADVPSIVPLKENESNQKVFVDNENKKVSSEDILTIVKTKLNDSNSKPLNIVLENNPSENFHMNLPIFGISISVKEAPVKDSPIKDNTTFGMSMPMFGFNITVDKDSSQCLYGTTVYDDFENIPNSDPCQLCNCKAGEIQCFIKDCVTPHDSTKCQKLPIEEGSCCPKYKCGVSEYVENPVGREDIPNSNVADTLDMLDKVKDSLLNIFNNATDVFQDINARPNESSQNSDGLNLNPNLKTSTPAAESGAQKGYPSSTPPANVIFTSVKENLDFDIEKGNGTYLANEPLVNQLDNPDYSTAFFESDSSETSTSNLFPFASTTQTNNKIQSSNNGSSAEGNAVINTVERTRPTSTSATESTLVHTFSHSIPTKPTDIYPDESTTKIFTTPSSNLGVKTDVLNGDEKIAEAELRSTTLSSLAQGSIHAGASNAVMQTRNPLDENKTYPPFVTNSPTGEKEFSSPANEKATGFASQERHNVNNEDGSGTHFFETSTWLDETFESLPTDNEGDSVTISTVQSTTITDQFVNMKDNTFADVTTQEPSDKENNDWKESVIGNKDVKVFLNFTWLDGSFTLEEDFNNPEYSKNLSNKIMKVLNSGVGYIIVPEGEQPEKQDEKTVHLIQTVKLDKFGNIDIETTISNSSKISYSDFDREFIKKVEEKTRKITEDIFDQMQNDLSVTSTESLISTKTEVDSAGTTQLPIIDPVILLALTKEWSSSNLFSNKEFDEYVRNFVEKSAGIKTRVVELRNIDETLDKYTDSYLVQGTVRGKEDFSFNIYHNKDKIENTNNFSEKEKQIVLILDSAINDFLLNKKIPNLNKDKKTVFIAFDISEILNDINGKKRLFINTLSKNMEDDTGLNIVFISDKDLKDIDELLNTEEDSYFIQGKYGNNRDINYKIYKNEIPLENLNKNERLDTKIISTKFDKSLEKTLQALIKPHDWKADENKLTTLNASWPEAVTVGDIFNEKDQDLFTTATSPYLEEDYSKPVIYISLNDDWLSRTTGYEQKRQLTMNLTDFLEEKTGIKTIIVNDEKQETLKEDLDKHKVVYLIQGEIFSEEDVNLKIYKNKIPLNLLDDSEMEVANNIKNVAETGVHDILDANEFESENIDENIPNLPALLDINQEVTVTNHDPGKTEEKHVIPDSILQAISNITGLTVLNHTSFASDQNNDTLLIFQDLLIDADQLEMLTSMLSSHGQLNNGFNMGPDSFPEELKNVVLNALNQTNIVPSQANILSRPSTTPSSETIPEKFSKPTFLLAISAFNDHEKEKLFDFNLINLLDENSDLSVVNIENTNEINKDNLMDQYGDTYFFQGRVDSNGEVNLTVYHNKYPLDKKGNITDREKEALQTVKQSIRKSYEGTVNDPINKFGSFSTKDSINTPLIFLDIDAFKEKGENNRKLFYIYLKRFIQRNLNIPKSDIRIKGEKDSNFNEQYTNIYNVGANLNDEGGINLNVRHNDVTLGKFDLKSEDEAKVFSVLENGIKQSYSLTLNNEGVDNSGSENKNDDTFKNPDVPSLEDNSSQEGNTVPDTKNSSADEILPSEPVIFIAIDRLEGDEKNNERLDSELVKNIEISSGISTLNVVNEKDEELLNIFANYNNSYFVQGKEQEDGKISANIFHNKIPLERPNNLSENEAKLLAAVKNAFDNAYLESDGDKDITITNDQNEEFSTIKNSKNHTVSLSTTYPVILVYFITNKSNKQNISEPTRQNFKTLIEENTGYKTIILNDEQFRNINQTQDKFVESILVVATIDDAASVNLDIYKNKTPYKDLNIAEKIRIDTISIFLNEGVEIISEALKTPIEKIDKDTSNENILNIQQNILNKLSNLSGIVLLNETDLLNDPTNDTLLIFQDILIDGSGNYNVSSIVDGQNINRENLNTPFSGLPLDIQNAVINALNGTVLNDNNVNFDKNDEGTSSTVKEESEREDQTTREPLSYTTQNSADEGANTNSYDLDEIPRDRPLLSVHFDFKDEGNEYEEDDNDYDYENGFYQTTSKTPSIIIQDPPETKTHKNTNLHPNEINIPDKSHGQDENNQFRNGDIDEFETNESFSKRPLIIVEDPPEIPLEIPNITPNYKDEVQAGLKTDRIIIVLPQDMYDDIVAQKNIIIQSVIQSVIEDTNAAPAVDVTTSKNIATLKDTILIDYTNNLVSYNGTELHELETENVEDVLHIFENVDFIIKNSLSEFITEMNVKFPKKETNIDNLLFIISIRSENDVDNKAVELLTALIKAQTKAKIRVFINNEEEVEETITKEESGKVKYLINVDLINSGDSNANILKNGVSINETNEAEEVSDIISTIKDSLEALFETRIGTKDVVRQDSIHVHIKTANGYTNKKIGESVGQIIKKSLESEIGLTTIVLINNPIEAQNLDQGILINLELNEKELSVINENNVGPNRKVTADILSIINDEVDSFNEKNRDDESDPIRLIVSIKSEDISDINKSDYLKSVLEDSPEVEADVFINESPIVIDTTIKEGGNKTTYLVKIKLTDDGQSEAIIYKDGLQLDDLSTTSFQEKYTIIPNIKNSIELIYNTHVVVVGEAIEKPLKLLIHIKTKKDIESMKKGEYFGEMIKESVEMKTGVKTQVIVNNQSIKSEVNLLDGVILLNLQLDDLISYEPLIELPLGSTKDEIDSIISALKEEIESLNREEGKLLIISVETMNSEDKAKIFELKSVLQDVSKIETHVFINEIPAVVNSMLRDSSDKTTYLVKVKLTDEGDSIAVIFKNGIVTQLDKLSLQHEQPFIQDVKNSIESFFNTKVYFQIRDVSNMKTIVLDIKTNNDKKQEEKGKVYGEVIEKTLENETGIPTEVFVNSPSLPSVKDRILINIEINDQISISGSQDNNKNEQIFEDDMELDSILSLIEAKATKLEEKYKNGEAIIISIKNENEDTDVHSKVETLKSIIEELTNLQTSVFVNEDPIKIENIQKDNDKITYLLNVDVTGSENSKVVVYKEGTSLSKLDAGSLDVIPQIKEALEEVYNTKLDIAEDNGPKKTFIFINIKTDGESTEKYKAQSLGKAIRKILQKQTGIETKVFIDSPSIKSEVKSNEVGIFVTFNLGEKLSIDKQLFVTQNNPFRKSVDLESMLSVINRKVESFNAELYKEQIIIAINGKNIDDDSQDILQNLLENDLDKRITIVVNKTPEFIEKMIKEKDGKTTIFSVELHESEKSTVTISKEGVTYGTHEGLNTENDIIQKIKEDIENVLDTTIEFPKEKKIILSIKTDGEEKAAAIFGTNLAKVLEDRTKIITEVKINKPITQSDEPSGTLLINLFVNDKISFDSNLVHLNAVSDDEQADFSIISIIEQEVQNENKKAEVTSENRKRQNLIIFIKAPNGENSRVLLKRLLEEKTGLNTSILLNKSPQFIEKKIQDTNGESTVIFIELLENENSKATIYEQGVPLTAQVGSETENDIIQHVKESVDVVFDTVLDFNGNENLKTKKIVIAITTDTDEEKVKEFGEALEKNLERNTGFETDILINVPYTKEEEDNEYDITLIRLLNEKEISIESDVSSQDVSIISVIEKEINAENERNHFDNGEQLIISIVGRGKEDIIRADKFKSLLEDELNLETSVFVNERATIIENRLKENNGKIKYLVNIELSEKEDAKATIYKKNTTLQRLDVNSLGDAHEIITKVQETVENVYGTNLNINQGVKAKRIIVNIKTTSNSSDIDNGQSFSELIQGNLEEKTGIKTEAFVNNPYVQKDFEDIILINVDVNGKLFFDGQISYTNQSFDQLSTDRKKEAIPIIVTLQEEVSNFNEKFDKMSRGGEAALILSIDLSKIKFPNNEEKAKVHRTVIEQLKIYLKQNTGLKNYVLIDRPETFTKNLLSSLENYFYIPVKVTRNNRIIQGQVVNKLMNSEVDDDELENLISDAVKEVLHWEYFSKEETETTNSLRDSTDNSNLLTLATLRPTPRTSNGDIPEVTTKYYKASQSYDRVIKILADLFIKTLDLSFRIKGAMDKSSKSGNNVEFKIVSKNEENRKNDFVPGDGNDPEIFVIPEMIKITPFDAMFVHNNESEFEDISESNQRKKPVIIDIENDQNINFNVSDGMVFEIDLSNLPSDKIDRENEIRLRVRNFIDGIKANEENSPITIAESVDNDSLSDAIIKNITQIVLIQMDEALKNKNDQIDWNVVRASTTEQTISVALQEDASTIYPKLISDPTEDDVIQNIVTSSTERLPLSTPGSTTPTENVAFDIPNPTIQQSTDIELEDFENESNKVINEVKNTISGIIKDVLSSQNNTDVTENNLDNIVQEIREKVPADVRIKTGQVDEKELQDKIKETVGKILTEEEIKSVVQLRNISSAKTTAMTTASSRGVTDPDDEISPFTVDLLDVSESTSDQFSGKKEQLTPTTPILTTTTPIFTTKAISVKTTQSLTTTDDFIEQENQKLDIDDVNLTDEAPFINIQSNEPITNLNPRFDVDIDVFTEKSTTTVIQNELFEESFTSEKTSTKGEEPGLVINLKDFSEVGESRQEEDEKRKDVDDIWKVILTASPADNELIDTPEVFISPSPAQTNEAQNIIQDGNLFADTSNSGVVKAKVVEDTSFARSIRPPNVGIAAIISIVIGILALLCFALMIFLAMARRRRQMEEMAPSTTAYTSTSRYTPEGTSSNISDMKATYIDELSPNVSSSDLQTQDVVIPMDGHQTIIGSYEDFLDVPTGARPNILQSLPISPTTYTENVPRTQEMTDPELAFTPRFKNYN